MSAPSPDQSGHPSGGKRGVMRNLGGFFGGILAGIKSDPQAEPQAEPGRRPPPPTAAAQRSHTETARGRDEEGRSVTLRRTVIEEIEVRDPDPDPNLGGAPPPHDRAGGDATS